MPTKSLVPDFNKWTTDEIRLLVVLLLTLIYPIFVTSFYALYLFVLLPVWVPRSLSFAQAHHDGWYHLYWLVVSLFWVFLCCLILPFFKKRKINHAMMDLGVVESSPNDAKIHPTDPLMTKMQVKETEGSQSSLSRKSINSTDNIKNDDSDIDVEKDEGDEKFSKSNTSWEKGRKITQSGELLTDFMTTIETEEIVKKETVCEVHVENNKPYDSDSDDKQNPKVVKEKYKNEASEKGENKALIKKGSGTYSDCSSSDEDDNSSTGKGKAKQPLKIHKATVEQHEETEDLEEVKKVNGNATPPKKRKKATPTIDTSRASTYYECSMPTPKSVDSSRTSQNAVFLYVNPDTAPTEDSVLVSHSGGVVEKEGEMGQAKV